MLIDQSWYDVSIYSDCDSDPECSIPLGCICLWLWNVMLSWGIVVFFQRFLITNVIWLTWSHVYRWWHCTNERFTYTGHWPCCIYERRGCCRICINLHQSGMDLCQLTNNGCRSFLLKRYNQGSKYNLCFLGNFAFISAHTCQPPTLYAVQLNLTCINQHVYLLETLMQLSGKALLCFNIKMKIFLVFFTSMSILLCQFGAIYTHICKMLHN